MVGFLFVCGCKYQREETTFTISLSRFLRFSGSAIERQTNGLLRPSDPVGDARDGSQGSQGGSRRPEGCQLQHSPANDA